MAITVLRLGHRPERDKRITTHVCLTARALNADRVLIAERDEKIVENVRDVTRHFGGPFEVDSGMGFRQVLRNFQGTKVHLTMYGMAMHEAVAQIDPAKDLLIVVGAEKVPREVYDLVDFNVSVGNQPHSEVAALAVFLYALQGPKALQKEFTGAEMTILPTNRGKRVLGERGGGEAAENEADPEGDGAAEDSQE
ncbi:MAG TPA: tRNA (cytidine(56)-2'-O)-methyltransferase [Candidatus Thermoplasmatota archaeon]|nr:tRNA (cytidine(56)-2'-O)-methyltransferase [Candidatus Thermoplasmatota archaeon]